MLLLGMTNIEPTWRFLQAFQSLQGIQRTIIPQAHLRKSQDKEQPTFLPQGLHCDHRSFSTNILKTVDFITIFFRLQLVMPTYKHIQECYDAINSFCNTPAKILQLYDWRLFGGNISKTINCIMLIRLGQTQRFSTNIASNIQRDTLNIDH